RSSPRRRCSHASPRPHRPRLATCPLRPPPTSTPFPYTTLFRSLRRHHRGRGRVLHREARDRPLEGRRHRGDQPAGSPGRRHTHRSEEHTSELQSRFDLVCRLLLEKKKKKKKRTCTTNRVTHHKN